MVYILTINNENTHGEWQMSKYEARIKETPYGDFFVFVVRIDYDGKESVVPDYRGRTFTTRKGAEKSTAAYIAKCA